MSTAVERAKQGDVATEASGPEEAKLAAEALEKLTTSTTWTREDVITSLTVPRGEEFLESTLVRFLRARKGDTAKAARMMDEALAFRKTHDVDHILERPIAKELLRHIRKGVYDGILPSTDKFGRPVYMLRGGASNDALHALLGEKPEGFEGEWTIMNLEDAFIHWHLIMIEYLTTVLFAEATAKAGRLINKYIVLDDLKGFSMHGVKAFYKVISCFKKTSAIDQLLYPELLGMLMFCNSPSIFRAPWKFISSFLEGDTARKIFVLGGPSQFEAPLDVIMDKKDLPEFFGGSLSGNHVSTYERPDTEVYDKIDDFVKANGERVGFDASKRSAPFDVLHIAARSEDSATIEVAAGQVAEWQFTLESHDVSYRAVFQAKGAAGDKDGLVVHDPERNPHASDIRVHASFRAEEDGTLTLELSNQHSRMRSKTVFFRLYTWQPEASQGDAAKADPSPTLAKCGPTDAKTSNSNIQVASGSETKSQ